MSPGHAVHKEYKGANLLQAIEAALSEGGVDPLRPGRGDLAAYDEMHVGGHHATADFIGRLGFTAGMSVLDIGAGLGGPARYVAQESGANVVGIDLSADYCAVATELSRRVGLGSRTVFRVGDAAALDLAGASFNGAYTIHAGMNIADKGAFYQSVQSVLKPGAVFGIYDVMAGDGAGVLDFPLPWASGPDMCHLVTPAETERLLSAHGFDVLSSENRAVPAMAALGRLEKHGIPASVLRVRGAEFATATKNLAVAIENGACAPWIFVARRV